MSSTAGPGSHSRQTRSGATFSAWDTPFSVVRAVASFNLKEAILQALYIQEIGHDLNDATDSPPAMDNIPRSADSSPLSSPLSSPPSSRAPSPALTPVSTVNPPSPVKSKKKTRRSKRHDKKETATGSNSTHRPPEPPGSTQKKSSKHNRNSTKHSHDSRANKRRKTRDPTNTEARPATVSRVLEQSVPLVANEDAERLTEESSGYIGRDYCDGSKATHNLDQVLAMGLELVKWDASFSAPIVDSGDRIFGALVEKPPNDPDWQSVQQDAADALEANRGHLHLSQEQMDHRRGPFPAVSRGNSMGGGQKYPKPLEESASNKRVVEHLVSLPAFNRLAGWASSAFAMWAPKLYKKYSDTMKNLKQHDPSFKFNWSTSIFAAATFNFGPQTVTYVHQDYLNYVFGWCAVTALGNYDYHRGGHLILWDLRLVIEFPPGATILIPSAYLRHSNTTIGPGERRYSFTQYTAGGIFRFVEDGFRTRASMSDRERKKKEKKARDGVSAGMNLYSTLAELRASSEQL
ncbi:hypothetical protein VKT23_020740 [Stygiomarasmius scandens]|uniref:Uncharacterized protein n=1 Tax=Marasmiellus scandens TaxID=2682957 RepID=A0ABR1IIH8_9AGAR